MPRPHNYAAAPEVSEEHAEAIEKLMTNEQAEPKFKPTLEQAIAAERKRIDDAKAEYEKLHGPEDAAAMLETMAGSRRFTKAWNNVLVSHGLKDKQRQPQTAKQKAAAKKKRKAQATSRRKNRK